MCGLFTVLLFFDDILCICRYLIWIVSGNTKPFVAKEEVELPLDWPTQCILMATKYHMTNLGKQYNIHPQLYAKVYELEKKNTRLHEKQWKDFLHLLSEDEEAAVLLRKQSKIAPIARVC